QMEPAALLAEGGPFDVVLSDMAPKTTGVRSADAARSVELASRAFWLATQVLKPGGHLLVKVFQGADLAALRQQLAGRFLRVRVEKPKASRSESVEVYLLAEGLQPASAAPVAAPARIP
ncbi:MAG TPA: RlmE family RNA methyltransferase, partial [bacterium]|nr:RlmE family RNA methyltransferase [bacterium]